MLKTMGRYFLCLRKGHITRNCPSGYKCMKCNGMHHVSFVMVTEEDPLVLRVLQVVPGVPMVVHGEPMVVPGVLQAVPRVFRV
uniref:CCHC-type domain-containing protein n=1 Tax=Amphimedon queenslandica TaxID=400682 RepID=A0A1X7TP77_AMPQE